MTACVDQVIGLGDYLELEIIVETEEEREKREAEEAAEEGAPRFTGPAGNKHGDGGKPFTVPKIF